MDKFFDERVRGTLEDFIRRAVLYDFTVMQEHDALGEKSGFFEIVRDQNDGTGQPRKFLMQLFLQLETDDRIERAERFVEQ